MTGHKPFSELTKDFSLERKAKIASLTNQLREEMTLQELREALNLHQTELSGTRSTTKAEHLFLWITLPPNCY